MVALFIPEEYDLILADLLVEPDEYDLDGVDDRNDELDDRTGDDDRNDEPPERPPDERACDGSGLLKKTNAPRRTANGLSN